MFNSTISCFVLFNAQISIYMQIIKSQNIFLHLITCYVSYFRLMHILLVYKFIDIMCVYITCIVLEFELVTFGNHYVCIIVYVLIFLCCFI